jgi:molecular chaperone HtpG
MSASKAELHNFSAEISKVLHLMIHSLYTNKDIFLRELISNASDACDKLRYDAITTPALLDENSALAITLSLDKTAKTLTITDTGIGMNRDELIANLGTIAKSGTQEFLSSLTGDTKKDLPLIGQFGVGFYSAFVVADKVTVISRKAGDAGGYVWESEGIGQFSLRDAENVVPRGTSITLHMRTGDEEYLDKHRLRHITQTYSDHISFPIEFKEADEKIETFNAAAALWTRAKTDITDEQYKEFYHHVAHSPDTPWMTLHNKAEGKLEYTNLLFIPSLQPFDLFHPDRKRRVKLYVKRVFITEEGTDLIPHYLRFLRGIIDSEDLPLNISREALQKNPMLDKIRESVCKRVLGELKKRAEKSPEDYAPFWKNFGAVLKEGLCEAIAPKEQILEACRFLSTANDKFVGLDEYVSRMKKGQEHIFYLTGNNPEQLAHSPQVEGFKKRGIEVLLLTDHVDDFWVNVVHEYKKMPFKSVTRSNIDLNAIEKEADEPDAPAKDSVQEPESMKKLIVALRAIYGHEIKDVRITHKLTDSPVCLSVEEGAMDIRLERFLREQKQITTPSAKILEINPSHAIIISLAKRVESIADSEDAILRDAALLLLDQARIIEGDDVSDAAAFSSRISRFLSQGLAAA